MSSRTDKDRTRLPRLGVDFVRMLHRHAGSIEHRLDRRRKKRDKRAEIRRAEDEY